MFKLIFLVGHILLMYSTGMMLTACDDTPRQEVVGSFATCASCSNVLHLGCYDKLLEKKCPSCRKPMITDDQVVLTDTVYVSGREECVVCIETYAAATGGPVPTAPPLDTATRGAVAAFAGIRALAGRVGRGYETYETTGVQEFDSATFHLEQLRLARLVAETKNPDDAARLKALRKQIMGQAFRHK